MSFQIVQLREQHIEDAAALFGTRYRTLREKVPLLPNRYEQANAILPMLYDLLSGSPGVVALQGNRLIGFLIGAVLPAFLGKRSVYSPEWANGAELGESRRVYEEMYAQLSGPWVADGCFTHLVSMLGHDREGIEGWQWLGFGLAAVDALRGLQPLPGGRAGLEVRRATLGDIGDAVALAEALDRHLAAPPAFWLHEHRDYNQWLRDPANALWLAHEGGEALGFMALEPGYSGGCQIIQEAKTVSIVGAFTQVHTRGRGIATALLNTAVEWAREEGYERCAVDFEPMNTLAARFWLRHFEPVCYTLMRSIDGRIGSWRK